jgi:tRNA A37 threonylcarbamoyladenosine dehydratase
MGISDKLKIPKVAIVGLSGTGVYVLDLVAKTPVQEIHLFDGDLFHSHNAFRSPGAASLDELRQAPKKVTYLP